VRTDFIQFLTYSAVMSSSIFIPILAKELDASPFFIGLVIASFNCLFFLSSIFFGFLSDKFGGRMFVCLGILLSSILIISHIFIKDAGQLFFIRAISGFVCGFYPAALSVYGFHHRDGRMGKFVGYGSLGWAFGSIVSGILQNYNAIFLVSGLFFLIGSIIALGEKRNFSKDLIEIGAFWIVFRRNIRLYISYFLRNLSATSIWAIFPLFLISLGANKFFIGLAYFLNTFSQFLITPFVEKYRNFLLIKTGLLGSSFVFLGYGFSSSYVYIFPIQFLLAFSYSTLQVGCLQELLSKNKEQSTSTGILYGLLNLSSVIGPILAGLILLYYDFKILMYIASTICLFSFFLVR